MDDRELPLDLARGGAKGTFLAKLRCRVPSSRRDYWVAKLRHNGERDRRTLRRGGWRVLTLWECQLGKWPVDRLRDKIAAFLDARAEG